MRLSGLRGDACAYSRSDNCFDATMLIYVLHHVSDPGELLLEAARVSRRRVIVLESTYRRPWERTLIDILDRAANRLRARGRMSPMEAYLHFRTFDEWRALFQRLDLNVLGARDLGGIIHHRSLFVIEVQPI